MRAPLHLFISCFSEQKCALHFADDKLRFFDWLFAIFPRFDGEERYRKPSRTPSILPFCRRNVKLFPADMMYSMVFFSGRAK